MYRLNPSNGEVRATRPHYGAGPPEPERFPAELALRDLAGTHGETTAPLILARYAVLRAWVLALGRTDPALMDHALAAARAHLAATPEAWPERALLDRLLDSPDPEGDGVALLLDIAATAEGAGHIDGSLAARSAAWLAAVRGLRLASAAELASGVAEFLRRQGAPATAEEWERTAARLGRAAGGWSPPSRS